jgi:ATP-dependent Clp protease ATP-binding subunit ClpA
MNAMFPAAKLEAERMGESEPGEEHLVLAALELPEGSARRAFERIGVDPGAFRLAISKQHDDALRAAAAKALDESSDDESTSKPDLSFSVMRTSPSAQMVFRKVVELVSEENSPLYGAFVVMVAAGIEQGKTTQALRSMGVEPADLVDAARAEVDALEAEDD